MPWLIVLLPFRTAVVSLLAGLSLSPVADAQSVFFNEIHYDNASTDANEAVEIAGPAGTDLTGWSVVLYNGNGGAPYGTLNLAGAIPDTCAGFGAVPLPATGIQNGSPDGLALVNALGMVVQFLSYEGPMTAVGGPANGMTSVDIGISEDGTGAADSSLQLSGTGTTYPDFTWAAATASMGVCNAGQTFVGGIDNPPSVFTSTPANGAMGVSAFANLSVTFSEDVSLAPTWFTLSCATSGSVSGAATGGPRTYAIDPAVNLAPNEFCALTVLGNAVTDLDGMHEVMGADATIGFTVAPDTAPTVAQTQPADNASGVAVDSNVVVTFSEPVTIAAGAFDLVCNESGAKPIAVSGGPVVFTLDPATDFDFLETCALTVMAIYVSDQDATVTAMAANVVVDFGTEQAIGDYYATADATNGATLRTTLNAIIDDHVRFPYTSSSTDTWDILDLADEDPANPTRVLDVYKNESYAKAGAGNSFYNREHRWAKSFGFPDDTSDSWAYTDVHHLIVSNSGYNSARNNRYFDNCPDTCTEYPTTLTNGIGGGSGTYPGNSNWGKGERWETWHYRKGDVARALLYMDVRYEGGTNAAGHPEPNLVLTDDFLLIQTTGGVNTTGTAYLGLRQVLIDWHEQDPPDELERLRNGIVQTYQQNRNPFVDHPEWVACVFENQCSVASNQAPTLNNATLSLFENSSQGHVLGTIQGSDPNAGQSLSYQIVSGNTGGAFAIHAASGQLSVANAGAINFEVTPSYSLVVRVTDSGSPALFADATIGVNVTNVDEGPALANDDTFTLVEDSPEFLITMASLLANDTPDPDDGSKFLLGVGNALHGTASYVSGSFSYVPDEDFCGADQFAYILDGGDSAIVDVTVTCVNDAPRLSIPANATLVENGEVTIGFNLGDKESVLSCTEGLSVAPDNPSLLTIDVFFEQQIGRTLYCAARLRGNPAQTGTAVVSLTTTDGELTGTDSITVTVTENDADNDGHADGADNCPAVANVDQADADADGLGDACDSVNDPRIFSNGFDS